MKLGRRCIQIQGDLSDAASVGKLIPRLLLSLDPPVRLAAPEGSNQPLTTPTTTTTTKNGTDNTAPLMIIEQAQQAPGVPVIPNNAIHILLNNAGVQAQYPAETYPMSSFSDVLQVNLSSPFQMSRDMGAYWLGQGLNTSVGFSGGCIINVSSILGSRGGIAMPAYATSKGGLEQVTKALSNEWAAKGIRVNAIAPGGCDTKNFMATDPRAAEKAKGFLERVPARRLGTPEDFKGVVVFLASEKASGYITGETVVVDGGWKAL